MRISRTLFLASWLMCLATAASATNYFVSPSGSDNNNGLSLQSPFQTVRRALNSATSFGDTVFVADGVYAENGSINMDRDGVTLKALGQNAILDGSNTGSRHLLGMYASDITVDGFEIRNSVKRLVSGGGWEGNPEYRLTLKNCVLHDSGPGLSGIYWWYTESGTLSNNEIYNTDSHGLYLAFEANNVIVENNYIHNTGTKGKSQLHCNGNGGHINQGVIIRNNTIAFGNGKAVNLMNTHDSYFVNNLIYDNHLTSGGRGAVVLGSDDDNESGQLGYATGAKRNVVANNTVISPNHSVGIELTNPNIYVAPHGAEDNVVFNNIVVASSSGIDDSGVGNQLGYNQVYSYTSSVLSSLFESAQNDDYRLLSGSAAHDAGTSSFAGVAAPALDMTGLARVEPFDVGAYEVGATQPGLVLNTSVEGSGSVTKSPDKTFYSPGEEVTLTAAPEAGWSFSHWSGAVFGSANPITVTVNGDMTAIAVFAGSGDTPPAAPQGLLVDEPGPEYVTVSWNANPESDIAGYELHYGPQSVAGGEVASYAYSVDVGNTISHDLPGISGRTYFAVRAYDDGGNFSTHSAEVTKYVVGSTPLQAFQVAYWSLDENSGSVAGDGWGTSNGTLENGASWTGSGAVSGAAVFDGNDDRIALGTMDVPDGTGLTIALWVKADDFGVHDARFVTKATDTSEQGHYWMLSTINQTALRFRLKTDGTTTTLVTTTGQIQAGQWFHIAATYDGAFMRIYRDGIEVASSPKTGDVSTNPGVGAAIGDQPAGAGNLPFDGAIDDVRIYRRPLGATEIAALAAMEGTNEPPTASFTATPTVGTAPLAVSFDAGSSTDPEAGALSYAWNFGDGGTGTGQNTSHTYTNAGSYTVTLTVTDDAGNTDTDSRTVGVTEPNSAPQASFSASPLTGLAPLDVSFDASVSSDPDGDPITYAWDFGDGGASTTVSPTHTYGAAGTYQATLTVRDDGNLSDSQSVTITVNPANSPPTAAFSASPTEGPSPLQVSFDARASSDPDGDPLTYTWDFGDGKTGNGSVVSHNYTKEGVYIAELTLTDDHNASDAHSVTITVGETNAPPTASFSLSPGSGDGPLLVDFDGSASSDPDGDPITLVWDFGDGNSDIGVATTHTYTTAGTYTVTLVVTDDQDASDSASRTITVTQANVPPVAVFDATPTSGIAPLEVTFDASASYDDDGDPITYQWDFGDGNVASGVTTSHTFTLAGEYNVTLTVSDGQGNDGTHSELIAVGELTAPPNPPSIGTVSEATPACVTVLWLPNSEPDLADYILYYGTSSVADGSASSYDDSLVVAASEISAEICGLSAGWHYFALRARNASGQLSGYSLEQSLDVVGLDLTGPSIVALSPPPGAVGVALDAVVRFALFDSRSGVDSNGVEVLVNGLAPASLSFKPEPSGYTVTCMPDGTYPPLSTITVEVTATDLSPQGNVSSDVWSFVTTSAPPEQPTGLVAQGGDIGCAELTWNANTEPTLSGYKILYGRAPSTYDDEIVVGTTTTSTVCGLEDGIYYFAIRAVNEAGQESVLSIERSATVTNGAVEGPLAPRNVRLQETQAGCVEVTWDANPEPDIAGYVVYWGTNSVAQGESAVYAHSLDVSGTTAKKVCNLPADRYYMAVRAYTQQGQVSGYSTERSVYVSAPDVIGPTVTFPYPGNGAVDVPQNTRVFLMLSDGGEGVDTNSVAITVNGKVPASIRFTGSRQSFGAVCDMGELLPSNTVIVVAATVRDLAQPSNETTRGWAFRTKSGSDQSEPVFYSRTPANGAQDVSPYATVMIELRDDIGIDVSRIELYVNGETEPVEVVLDPLGYVIVTRKNQTPLPSGDVEVHVIAHDHAGNRAELTYSFTVAQSGVVATGPGAIVPDGYWADDPERPLEVHDLPVGWTVRIFDTSGVQVRSFHNEKDNGMTWLWDFANDHGRPVAKALYLVRVLDEKGNVQESGKFLVRLAQ